MADATGRELDPDLARIARNVAERSRGNAFFVGELWRRLLELGVVRREGDRWIVDGTIEDVGVPDSVREVVADRLGRLAYPARRLAELVAISGHRVELQVLSHAADLPAAELATSLDALVTADLLEVIERPQLTYQFTHALVRDTVEAKVPPAARAHLHLRLAEALEAVYESDRRGVLAELANHFAAAASLGEVAKATYYARQAADQARRSLAYEECLAHLETVLALSDDRSITRVETLLDVGWTETRRSQFEDARTRLRRGVPHRGRARRATARGRGRHRVRGRRPHPGRARRARRRDRARGDRASGPDSTNRPGPACWPRCPGRSPTPAGSTRPTRRCGRRSPWPRTRRTPTRWAPRSRRR